MLHNIRIDDVLRDEGIEVNRRRVFRCPFHDDRHPSAHVYPDGRFHCFGCGAHGDAIDFIMQLKGFTFKEASSYLGITPQKEPISRKERTERERKRHLVAAFREWERNYYDELAAVYRATFKLMGGMKSMEEVAEHAILYKDLPVIEYKMDLLLNGDDEEKYRLFKEKIDGRI